MKYSIKLENGTDVNLLVTPYVYVIAKEEGLSFDINNSSPAVEIFSTYADIMYCAALNFLRCTGLKGKSAPFQRIDFHEYLWADPKRFKEECLRISTALEAAKEAMMMTAEAFKARKEEAEETDTSNTNE